MGALLGGLLRVFSWVSAGWVVNDIVDGVQGYPGKEKQSVGQAIGSSLSDFLGSIKNIALVAVILFLAFKFIIKKK